MSEPYFDRMTRVEGNLADIRRELGVSNRPQATTMIRVRELTGTERSMLAIQRRYRMLATLINGCKRHRSYRAIRKPQVDCGVCKEMFQIRQVIGVKR